jgi:hypothetical protein
MGAATRWIGAAPGTPYDKRLRKLGVQWLVAMPTAYEPAYEPTRREQFRPLETTPLMSPCDRTTSTNVRNPIRHSSLSGWSRCACWSFSCSAC